jgi:hypothetical protein
MRTLIPRVAVAAISLAVVTRGATAQVVRETDELGREIVRRCQPTEWPKKLPALNAVLDSVALWTSLGAAAAADTSPMLFSIIYRDKEAPLIRVLEPTTPSGFAVSLVGVVGGGLRDVAPPQPPRALRVRARAGSTPAATVERSVYCPPELATGGNIGPTTTRVYLERGDRIPPGRTLRLEAEWTVSELGQVTNFRVIRGSGIRELDESMVTEMQQRTYRPALLDGMRVASWARSSGRKMEP